MPITEEPRRSRRLRAKVRTKLNAREKFFLCAVCRDLTGAYFAPHPCLDYFNYRELRAVNYRPSSWFRSNADSAVRQMMRRAKNHLVRVGYIWVDGEYAHTRLVSVTAEGFDQLDTIACITAAEAEAIQAGYTSDRDYPDGMRAKCQSCSDHGVSLEELREVEALFRREAELVATVNDWGCWNFRHFSISHPHCLRCATVAIAYCRAAVAMDKLMKHFQSQPELGPN